MAPPKTMINLLDYTLPELTDWMQNELGEPKFRAVQVWQWIWQKMARDFDAMTNVSKACRERLAQCAEIRWPEIVTVEQSSDDTTKFLLRLQDGAEVETVLIPSDSREGVRRWTQCLSSQVGCAMACTFCSTGTMGFERNMTMGEILGQILVAREHLGDTRPDWPVLRNLVFMGMGEPLLNLIVYNPSEGDPYKAPSPERVLAFEQYLWDRNITAIIRKSKGQDIKAACGQLKAARQNEAGEQA